MTDKITSPFDVVGGSIWGDRPPRKEDKSCKNCEYNTHCYLTLQIEKDYCDYYERKNG